MGNRDNTGCFKRKHQHRGGKTAHFFIWYRSSVTDKKVVCLIFVPVGIAQNKQISNHVFQISFLGFKIAVKISQNLAQG